MSRTDRLKRLEGMSALLSAAKQEARKESD